MRVVPGRQVGELYAVGLAFTPRLGPVTEKVSTKIAAVFTQVPPPLRPGRARARFPSTAESCWARTDTVAGTTDTLHALPQGDLMQMRNTSTPDLWCCEHVCGVSEHSCSVLDASWHQKLDETEDISLQANLGSQRLKW